MLRRVLLACVVLSPPRALAQPSGAGSEREWRITGGVSGNTRYSVLDQINTTNVSGLAVAWTYRTGDGSTEGQSQIQATPIVVRGVLYSTSPALKVFALRAETGEELWRFDPFATRKANTHANRGVVFWEDQSGQDRRIFFTAGTRLYALNAESGRPIATFGDSGSVDLATGLGRDVTGEYLVATSPGVIYKDLLIQGTRVSEGDGAAPGHVRAYDVRTGKIRWTFHTIPHAGEFGTATWPNGAWKTAGGANSWPGMTVDVDRGLVFVPTGSPSPDFFGGGRVGANLFGNTLLALNAATGKRVWHFQTVHHDIWDRDLPAAPNLLTVRQNGRRIDAVAQITKSGYVFVFDRVTGKPLFPVEERPFPKSTLPGERTWPTQPIPTKPAPFARQTLTEADLTDLSPASHDSVLARYRTFRQGGLYTPPSLEGSIVFPGYDGGGEWGGAAVDPETGVMYVNASDVPWIAQMVPVPQRTSATSGRAVYGSTCASCHRADRRGDGGRIPSLIGVASRLTAAEMREIVDRGKGFMPAFARALSEPQRNAVVAYLRGDAAAVVPAPSRTSGDSLRAPRRSVAAAPYRLRDYERWKDPDGYPAVKPPWGTLNAIDLNTGDYLWRIPLGEFPELTAKGISLTGTEQYGGPIVTAGGVVFIAATQDEKFRAFDKRTGALLWETTLPAAGYATPSTFEAGGRQFVVIAAGGGKLGTKSGDSYVAFALP
jgi:quinoprotein glucose dehydrogenase